MAQGRAAMTSKNSSQPQPVDAGATAAAQGAANKDTAIAQARLNQVDEYTPFGSSVFEKTGNTVDGIDQMKRTTTLSPAQQAIVDQQMNISGQLNNTASQQLGRVDQALATPFSYQGMPDAPVADSAARQQTIDSLYNQYSSRLDPRFQQERSALDTQLANSGITAGSQAYNDAVDAFGRTKNDAYTSAMNQAVSSGGQEQSRLFGLQGDARSRAIQEAAYSRAVPLNDIASLMGTAPGVTMPQFSPMSQTSIAPTDVTGAVGLQAQGQQANYAQAMGQQNALMGGLFGLGGAALGGAAYSGKLFSDARLKRDIKKVGKLDNGLNVYLYRYKFGGPMQIGVMAHEVEKIHPEAVSTVNGFKAVQYDRAVA
jgi:hypothetical protein